MSITRRHALSLFGAAAIAPGLPSFAVAAPGRLYPIQERVKSFTSDRARVAALPTGGFVLASESGDGGLVVNRYTATAALEQTQRLAFAGRADQGQVVPLITPSGDGLMVFVAAPTATPGVRGVFALPVDAASAAAGPAVRINLPAEETIHKVAACLLADGSVLAAWRDGTFAQEYVNVRYRILGLDGVPKGGVQTIKRTSGRAGHTLMTVAALPDGGAYIAYFRHGPTYRSGPVLLQRIDAAGLAVGAPVNLGTTSEAIDLASTPEGVAAIWIAGGGRGGLGAVGMRKIRADGKLGAVRTISVGFDYLAQDNKTNLGPKLTLAADGRFAALVAGYVVRPDDYANFYVKAYVTNSSLGFNSETTLAYLEDPFDEYQAAASMGLPLLTNGSLVAHFAGFPRGGKLQRMRLI